MDKKIKIEYVKISELKLSDYNPKKYDQKASRFLHNSIATYGYVMPFLVNRTTGNVIDGNQKLKDALREGNLDTVVPVVYVDYSPEQEKALNRAIGSVTQTNEDEEMAYNLLKEVSDLDELSEAEKAFMNEILALYQKEQRSERKKFEPEMSIVVDADEMYDYLLFVCDKGVDFLSMSDFFALTSVYDLNREKTLGLGRAIRAEQLAKLIEFARKNGIANINQL